MRNLDEWHAYVDSQAAAARKKLEEKSHGGSEIPEQPAPSGSPEAGRTGAAAPDGTAPANGIAGASPVDRGGTLVPGDVAPGSDAARPLTEARALLTFETTSPDPALPTADGDPRGRLGRLAPPSGRLAPGSAPVASSADVADSAHRQPLQPYQPKDPRWRSSVDPVRLRTGSVTLAGATPASIRLPTDRLGARSAPPPDTAERRVEPRDGAETPGAPATDSGPATAESCPSPERTPIPESSHSAVEHSAVEHSAVEHSAVEHSAVEHSAVEHSAVEHSAVEHSAVEHSAVEHSAVEHSAVEEARPAAEPRAQRERPPRPPVSGRRARRITARAAAAPPPIETEEQVRALWDRVPSHVQALIRTQSDEVAQRSYQGFRESREDLIRRLLDPELSLEEAARILGVCPTTVRRYTNRELLSHHRTSGNQRRFRLSHVLEFMDRFGRPASAEEDQANNDSARANGSPSDARRPDLNGSEHGAELSPARPS